MTTPHRFISLDVLAVEFGIVLFYFCSLKVCSEPRLFEIGAGAIHCHTGFSCQHTESRDARSSLMIFVAGSRTVSAQKLLSCDPAHCLKKLTVIQK